MDLNLTVTVKDFPEGFDHFARELAAKVAGYLKADLKDLAEAQEKVINTLAKVEALAAAREVRAPYNMPPIQHDPMRLIEVTTELAEDNIYDPHGYSVPAAPPDAPEREGEQALFPGPVPQSGDATDMARRQAMQSHSDVMEKPYDARHPVTESVDPHATMDLYSQEPKGHHEDRTQVPVEPGVTKLPSPGTTQSTLDTKDAQGPKEDTPKNTQGPRRSIPKL